MKTIIAIVLGMTIVTMPFIHGCGLDRKAYGYGLERITCYDGGRVFYQAIDADVTSDYYGWIVVESTGRTVKVSGNCLITEGDYRTY